MRSGLHLLVVTFVFLTGCSDSGDDAPPSRCAEETRALTYEPNMVVVGDASVVEIQVVEASPAPPDKGDNSWLLEVRDATTSTGMAGVDLTIVPFMPDHGHGSPITPSVTPAEGEGRFQVDDINLWMPGLWEVRIDVTGSATDRVVVPICIEG